MTYFIGVDVGGTNLRAARFKDQSHTPEAKAKTPTLAAKGRDTVLGRLERVIRDVCPDDISQVTGIGLAIPGPVNPQTGVLVTAANIPGWDNVPLKQIMEDRLGRPVDVGNDANLAALGEWKFGAGRGHQDVLFLTISTGIGGGVISGGKMLLGAQGLGAELGHILAVPDGPLCGCGQRGHLEAVASGTAIGRLAQARLRAGDGPDSKIWELASGEVDNVTGAVVGEAALAGDDLAVRLIAEAGLFLGRTLASLLSIFNPSVVIMGGGVSMLGDVLFTPVREAVKRHAMSDAFWRNCPIVPAALGDDAGLVGAGALAMETSAGR
jgi:glucokinase